MQPNITGLKMPTQSLNIGCGSDSWGDVRVDIAFDFLTMKCKPTILAHACHLPFKEKCFEEIKASHVLEHLENPIKALDEMLRVCSNKVRVSFPAEYDVLPWIFSNIFPIPSYSAIQFACITRKKGLHLWVIDPLLVDSYLKENFGVTSIKKVTVSLFRSFGSGKKARVFGWLTKYFQIPYEYVVTGTKESH